jgi:soluble lytic murein transglycosylase-like protein
MYEIIVALILRIATETGVPPYFALAIAIEENWTLDPDAQNTSNSNGTTDLGVMQLNSRYYGDIEWQNPETNIRAGCQHIKRLMDYPGIYTFWAVAAAYNCGEGRFLGEGPPPQTIEYANNVMKRWSELTNGNITVLLAGKR